MLDNELKNKINSLWEIFWTGGITNPLDVVEQMTYLMFIHDLDAADNQRAKESAMLGLPRKSIFAGNITIGERSIPGELLKRSVFRDFPAAQMYSVLQEPPFTDRGSVVEVFTDLSLWAKVKHAIDSINANAAA